MPIPADGMDRISEETRSFSDSSLFTGPFSGQFKPYIRSLDASVVVQQRDDEFVHEAVKYFDRRVVTFRQDRLVNSYARRLEAQLALRDGEYEQALERLNESRLGFQWLWSGRPFLSQVPDNAMRVEALYALGRTEEAQTWLEAIGDGLSSTKVSLGFLYQDIAPSYVL